MSKLPALIKLLRKGDHQKLKEMLHSQNININEIDPKSGKALIHLIIQSSDEDALNIITKYPGVDLELAAKDGELPLEMAVRLNDAALVAKLLQLKANPRRRSSFGETVLCTALSLQTSKDILKRLFHHIDPNQRLQSHGSYLNLALSSQQADNVHILLEEGVKYTIKDQSDNTSLILAVKANRGDCLVAILERLDNDPILTAVEKQFFFNAQNSQGNTALHEAVLRDYQTITQKLEIFGSRLGFDYSLKNKKGQTIESIRASQEKAKVSEVQLEKKRQEERVVRRRQKEQEKIRLREQEERERVAQKLRRKQEEERLQLQTKVKNETQKKQTLWIGAILLVVILGGMYLMLTNAIQKKKAPTF